MQEEMQKQNTANQIEDSAMKTMVRFFADEMLPYLGIQGKVKMVAPTEEIHMEIKRVYEDMNLNKKSKRKADQYPGKNWYPWY